MPWDLENASLASGYDALCIITNPMPADLLDAFREEGIKNLATRGFIGIPKDCKRKILDELATIVITSGFVFP
ncbi:MAG: hypothetical protein MSA61_01960 [Coriobacteriaceae bacterium]|nr:hypothetical protein [Coriobacteriaceae bacterium]MCI7437973.1 hypothetical protein [Coriobacteriaceae bacterium]